MSFKSDKEADQRAAAGDGVLVQSVLAILVAVVFFGLVIWMFAGR